MTTMTVSVVLRKGDIVEHPDHGEGIVTCISRHAEYPVEATFKDSPLLRIRVPITLCFTPCGLEVSSDPFPKRIKKVTCNA